MAGVAEEAGEFGALDGAAGKDGGELRLSHMATFIGSEGEERRARAQRIYDRLGGGIGIVGANGGTGVTTVETAVEVGAGREIATMLDGEI